MFGGSLGERPHSGGPRRLRMVGFIWEEDWRAPKRLLVVQTGESASQANAFKAHAVPLCENLINALKLLANHLDGGVCPFLCIVEVLCESNRKGILEGLRNFFAVDNHCALEVGHLKEGTRFLRYEGQSLKKVAPRCRSVTVPEELTLRTEEVASQKSCINVDHIALGEMGSALGRR